jgi:hypothetical protein
MRVTSLLALHIPPILVGVIMGMIFGLLQGREAPLPVNAEGLRIGYATFLKRNVFIETEDYTFYLDTGGDTSALFVYSRSDSNLIVDGSIAFGEEIRLDREGNRVLFRPGAGRRGGYEVPFDEFVTYEGIWTESIVRSYARRLRSIYGQLRIRMNALDRQRSFILMGVLLLSTLMIIIPLTFGLNEHGWGFSGVVGVFLVLGLLPYIYALILGGINRLSRDPQFLGGYTYLFPAAVFAMLGILLDIIVTMRRSAR